MAEQELELIHFSHLQSTFMQQGVGMKWNHSQPCGFFSYTTGRHCCRKGDPFQGLKLGSCLTLGNELSEETHVLTKREILLGKAPGWRAGGEGNPGELLYHVAHSLGFYGDEVSFWVVFGQSS